MSHETEEENHSLKAAQNRRSSRRLIDLGVKCHDEGDNKQAMMLFRQALLRDPDSYIPYFNIAGVLRDMNESERAIFFYQKALELRPDVIDIYINLAALYRDQDKHDKALELYRRILQQDPDNALAKHLLCTLTGTTPPAAPLSYIERLFDHYADTFDEHLIGSLHYQTPHLLFDLAARHLGPTKRFSHAVDLGCGTGLAGALWRERCDHLIGVDLSANMLQAAGAKNIYHELVQTNIIDYLATAASFDLLIAADVLPYFGELDQFFALLSERSHRDALMIFSTESCQAPGYRLARSARFEHNSDYVVDLATRHGLTLVERQSAMLRLQKNQDVAGELFLFMKHSF